MLFTTLPLFSRCDSLDQREEGFTLVELMIATAVYSLVLLIALLGITQVGRMYYRGLSAARTQEAARDVMDDVSREIQFSSSTVQLSGAKTLCIGNKRYAFDMNKRLVDGAPQNAREANHALQKDSPGAAAVGCPAVANQSDLTRPIELLSNNMRLAKFSVTPVGGSNNQLWNVTIKVIFGEDDLLTGLNMATGDSSNAQCTGSTYIGGQFCAVSELSTTVVRRLK